MVSNNNTHGSFHTLTDLVAGSSGKGSVSPRLTELLGVHHVSCHNGPGSGHSMRTGANLFVSKVIPTPMYLKKVKGTPLTGLLSPGCAFRPAQLLWEWDYCSRPQLLIHDRAVVVTEAHAEVERGAVKRIASTMQGGAAAMCAKVMRHPDTTMARHLPDILREMVGASDGHGGTLSAALVDAFLEQTSIVSGQVFRDCTFRALEQGCATGGAKGILHEGSQGYALSINHGLEWPHTTSRDCDTMTAMSYMAIPPQSAGRVFGVLRANHMIRVGNVVEDGKVVGDSGGGYPDQHETTWEALARAAGMPEEEIAVLKAREHTTVSRRLRKVFTESRSGLADAIRTCGVTDLVVNFVQYIDWKDNGVRDWSALSTATRKYIDGLEDDFGVRVCMAGTGADHLDFALPPNAF